MKFKRENKGFSLVELIVVIAIFSVVGVVVGAFLLTASRSYSINATELNLQEEAQLVSNQVQEMILDTAYGISYQYVATDNTGAELIQYMVNDAATPPAGDLTNKDVYIYGQDQYYHISWDKETAELYLQEYVKDATTGSYVLADGFSGLPDDRVMFGQYVSDFNVDLSQVASERLVHYNITFKKPGSDRDYLVTRTVSLRNNVLMNKPIEEVYEAAGVEFQPAPDNLEVVPTAVVRLWPGESQKYQVILTCSRGGVPNQDASWSVVSADGTALSGDTKMSGGNILSIGLDEKNTDLNLQVWADGYDYTANATKVIRPNFYPTPLKVEIKQITGLVIGENTFESTPIISGGQYTVKVQMTGEHLDGLNMQDVGGLDVAFTTGGDLVDSCTVTYSGMMATCNVRLKAISAADLADGSKQIGLQFRPTKEGFTGIHAETPVYKISGSTPEMLKIENVGSSMEWLRLGKATQKVIFTSSSLRSSYCKPNGELKDGYSIKYTYRIADSDRVYEQTATSIAGYNSSKNLTSYITSIRHDDSAFKAEAKLSDSVFLQSGMVVVGAELWHTTAGKVGDSNFITYTIPQATIAFKRAQSDVASSSMKSYITKNLKQSQVYVTFPTGFATNDYKIALDKFSVVSTEHGNIDNSLSDVSSNRVTVVGKADADYRLSKGNTIELTYGGLPNKVTVTLASPNVEGTDCYIPLSMDEWDHVYTSTTAAGDIQKIYNYYVDDTHKMIVVYENDVLISAQYSAMVNMQWKYTNYTMNTLNRRWDIALP